MSIAVIGSRSIENYEALEELLQDVTCEIVISGGAQGVDTLAERWAKEHGKQLQVIRPDYKKYGHQAPVLRNLEIVDKADIIYVLWDGESKGTRMLMDYARKQGKHVICKVVADSKQLGLF